jgi:hypothetical protein
VRWRESRRSSQMGCLIFSTPSANHDYSPTGSARVHTRKYLRMGTVFRVAPVVTGRQLSETLPAADYQTSG